MFTYPRLSKRSAGVDGIALATVLGVALVATPVLADDKPDESALGEFVVTGSNTAPPLTKLAILPSLSPAFEDVIVRGVVRRDMELSGMFRVISDKKAPPGTYDFDDPVDIDAWKKIGAEVIVKVAARDAKKKNQVEVFGLAYFLNVGKDPVYEKKLIVDKKDARVTGHRITDALLGAITGRPGGFASQMTYAAKWGRNRVAMSMDSDGHNPSRVTDPKHTAIAPTWGPNHDLYYLLSKNYEPFALFNHTQKKYINLSEKGSIYSVAFNSDRTKIALAIAKSGKIGIYSGNADGSGLKKVSTTTLATHPVFSPSGKLAWVGGNTNKKRNARRVYVDGKAVSPGGFTASAPTFCDTENGIKLIYSVNVGGDRRDIVMSQEKGGGTVRLTKNQGSNTYPACSKDGRLVAFFSTRRHKGKKSDGIYMMNLSNWRTIRVSGSFGESLRWDPLPPPAASASAASDKKPAKKPAKSTAE